MKTSLRKKHKGMSYAEVTISFLVASLFILPIYSTFINATGTQLETRSIQQSTLYSETLLDNIKWKLEKDLEVAHEVAYNRSNETPAYYLNPYVAPEVQKAAHSFEEVFDYVGQNAQESLNQLYNTDRYAYEVAIWDLNEMLTEVNTLDAATQTRTIGFGLASKAVKWYSNPNYILDKYYHDSILPTFSIDEGLTTIFKNDLYLTAYSPNSENSSSISGVVKLTLGLKDSNLDIVDIQRYGTLGISDGTDMLDCGQIPGRNYVIHSTNAGANDRGLVIIDTRGVDFTSVEIREGLFRVENTSELPLMVKVLSNETDMEKIDKFIKLFFTNSNTENSINIEYVHNIALENSYLIGIIVRDLSPALGKGGKVIKTMFDIYSYAPKIS